MYWLSATTSIASCQYVTLSRCFNINLYVIYILRMVVEYLLRTLSHNSGPRPNLYFLWKYLCVIWLGLSILCLKVLEFSFLFISASIGFPNIPGGIGVRTLLFLWVGSLQILLLKPSTVPSVQASSNLKPLYMVLSPPISNLNMNWLLTSAPSWNESCRWWRRLAPFCCYMMLSNFLYL